MISLACTSDLHHNQKITIEMLMNKVNIPGRQLPEILRLGQVPFCDIKIIEISLIHRQVPLHMVPLQILSRNLPLNRNPLDLILGQLRLPWRVTHV